MKHLCLLLLAATAHIPTPAFDWHAYLAGVGLADLARINVSEPAFFRALQAQLASRPLSDFQAYLQQLRTQGDIANQPLLGGITSQTQAGLEGGSE